MSQRQQPSPVWIIVAPAQARRLEKKVADYRRKKKIADRFLPPWEVVAGARDHSAIVNRNPGTTDTHEGPLASELSVALRQPVYVFYPENRTVLVYEKGKCMGEDP
jgi:hypothetical protein